MTNQISSDHLDSVLHDQFGFQFFRPGQQEAIEQIIAGNNTLVVMPTGHGKSLIYQLTALLLPNTTLVISPLISLMKDQVDSLVRNKISASFINSSLSYSEQSHRLRNLNSGRYKIFLVAPERLRSQDFRYALSNVPISLLVVDEAHCLSQWGHDFRPDYLHIADFRHQCKDPTLLALTATATPQVQKEIGGLLGLNNINKIVTGFNRPNLTFEVVYLPDMVGKYKYIDQFMKDTIGAGIIYSGTRRDVEEISEFVCEVSGKPARFYHAGLSSKSRNEVQELFISGELSLVAATNAFGMGIDRPDVRFVLHHNMPGTIEAYYQEAGRAGRDGKPARAVLLYSPDDIALQEYFIENDSPTIDEVHQVHNFVSNLPASPNQMDEGAKTFHLDDLTAVTSLTEVKARVAIEHVEAAQGFTRKLNRTGNLISIHTRQLSTAEFQNLFAKIESRRRHRHRLLNKMVAYAESNKCRRRIILGYFGEKSNGKLRNCCDNCVSIVKIDKDLVPGKSLLVDDKLIILDTVFKLQWGIGKRRLAQILKGSSAKAVDKYKNHLYYGIFFDQKIKGIGIKIEELISGDFLKSIGNPYPTIALTPKGERVLANKDSGQLKSLISKRKNEQHNNLVLGDTFSKTRQLLAKGLSPAEIAAKRGLSLRTIYSHIAKLIGEGKIHIDTILPAPETQLIRTAIERVGSTERLSPIKAQLPDSIDFNKILCVVAAWNFDHQKPTGSSAKGKMKPKDKSAHVYNLGVSGAAEHVPELITALVDPNGNVRRLAASALGKIGSREAVVPLLTLLETETKPQVRQYTIKALGAIGDNRAYRTLEKIADDPAEKEYNRSSAKKAIISMHTPGTKPTMNLDPLASSLKSNQPDPPEDEPKDPINDFLSSPHPRQLTGPWLVGWALDYHSRYVGSELVRSSVGLLVHRYKYMGEHSLAGELADHIIQFLEKHPELPRSDAIIPIPPSVSREFDPVTQLAQVVATRLNIPADATTLVKTRITRPQKELNSLAAKRRNMLGAFRLCGNVSGKQLMLLDDLFDSGSTLNEAARILGQGHPASIFVLTLTKTIHSTL